MEFISSDWRSTVEIYTLCKSILSDLVNWNPQWYVLLNYVKHVKVNESPRRSTGSKWNHSVKMLHFNTYRVKTLSIENPPFFCSFHLPLFWWWHFAFECYHCFWIVTIVTNIKHKIRDFFCSWFSTIDFFIFAYDAQIESKWKFCTLKFACVISNESILYWVQFW